MKQRTLFIIKYFTFWICLFVAARIVFLLYEYNQSFSLPATTWMGIMFHGLKLDISMAGYITMLPATLMLLTTFTNHKPLCTVLAVYTALTLALFLLIAMVDMEMYKYWGTRVDKAPLRFLSNPGEVLSSSSMITILLYSISFVLMIWWLTLLYKKHLASSLVNSREPGIKGIPVYIFIIGLLILPVRGGIGVSPVNTGSVYFSKTVFANHAAINPVWNLGQSLIENKESENPYIFDHDNDFSELFRLYETESTGFSILKNNRPNIILIVLESFTAKVIETLGGTKGITPRFNELCQSGVFFTNIYSTDSRTDKGIATILSGYPVLESIPIMKYPEKTQNLPFLTESLAQYGYRSSFLYGGDPDFANMRSYLVNAGFSNIVSESDFPFSERTGKWGVADNYVFDRFINDIESDTGRWFKVMLTLSNHEPFEINTRMKFGNKTLTDKFYSTAYYADSCLGSFIDRLKQSPVWNNTVVIMIADHGTRLPEFDDAHQPRKHHIPMLWTGGAVSADTVICKKGSQADLALTLLNQLGIPPDGYVLGKDLLSPESRSFAFYSVKNGIGLLTDSSGFVYDFIAKDFIYRSGKIDSAQLFLARSLQQFVFDNYLKL